MPASAAPIKGLFNRPDIRIAEGLADRLLFDPMRVGSQFYPTLKSAQIGQLLDRSMELAQRGFAHLPGGERNSISGFVTTLDVGKKIGFDAYRDLGETDGMSALNERLRLSPLGGGKIHDVAISQPTEDDLYDPFFTFLIASRLQAHFKVERQPDRPPVLTLDDAEVTSRPGPAFRNDNEIGPHGPLLLLGTPAQRLVLWDMLMGPKARFGKRTQPEMAVIFLPHQAHPKPVANRIARLALGGSSA